MTADAFVAQDIVPVLTSWTATNWYSPSEEFGISVETAAACDALYRAMVVDVVLSVMPWLPDALQAIGAAVAACPGCFLIVTRDGQQHPVPELAARLNFLPWAEPSETRH
jgi:hypothetical protein